MALIDELNKRLSEIQKDINYYEEWIDDFPSLQSETLSRFKTKSNPNPSVNSIQQTIINNGKSEYFIDFVYKNLITPDANTGGVILSAVNGLFPGANPLTISNAVSNYTNLLTFWSQDAAPDVIQLKDYENKLAVSKSDAEKLKAQILEASTNQTSYYTAATTYSQVVGGAGGIGAFALWWAKYKWWAVGGFVTLLGILYFFRKRIFKFKTA